MATAMSLCFLQHRHQLSCRPQVLHTQVLLSLLLIALFREWESVGLGGCRSDEEAKLTEDDDGRKREESL